MPVNDSSHSSLAYSYRLGVRCISSVVPKSDIAVTDFTVKNEPVLGYLPGSQERADLEAALKRHQDVTEDVPIVIGGKEYRTDQVQYQPMVFAIHLVRKIAILYSRNLATFSLTIMARRWPSFTTPLQSWSAKPSRLLFKLRRNGREFPWIKDSNSFLMWLI